MGIERVSSASVGNKHTRALERAVDLSMAHVKKVQARGIEDLRMEDPIRSMSVHGSEVHVSIDDKYGIKPDMMRAFVKDLLAKNGAKGVRVELSTKASPKDAVDAANTKLQQIHQRLTTDVRVEDSISNLFLRDDKSVSVVVRPHSRASDKDVLSAAKALLAEAGLKGVKLSLVIPAIEPVPRGVVVDRAFAAIQQVQQRLTTDIRAEDSVVGMHLDGNDVRVALRAHTTFSETDLKAMVQKHLDAAGLRGATISFIRPAIDPIRRPTAPSAPIHTGMKDRVGIWATNISTVQHRMTEEIRVEDAVKSVKLKGASIEITVRNGMAVDLDNVKAWAKEEMTKRHITLPVTFKTVDR